MSGINEIGPRLRELREASDYTAEQLARELLSTSGLKVREIAARCGYTDQHYFSYCFKKYCGESPTAMRRRLGGERTGEEP